MRSVPRLIRWLVSLAIFFLVVMTVLRVITYVALMRDRLPLDQAWAGFWLGGRFDARIVASALLPVLALGNFAFLNPFNSNFGRRLWLSLLGIFSGLLLVFYATDFLHYRYLNQRLNASLLGYVEDLRISATMVWQTYPVVRIFGVITLALAAGLRLVFLLHRRAAAAAVVASRRSVQIAWWIASFVVVLLSIFGRVGQYPLRWSDAFNLRSDILANLALNPLQSFFSSLEFRSSGFDAAKVSAHYPAMSAYLGITSPNAAALSFQRHLPARPGGPVHHPNVVLVICESFSAYKSSMWGNPLDTTPFFNQLCQQGLFFENCFTPHYGTARGVWATLTGIPDVEAVETASRNPALVDQHTIINDFVGYEKFYFIGGSSSWANIRGLLTNNILGLKLFEEDSFRSPRADVWGISDKNLFQEAHEVLTQQTKPFFAIIQTADNHRPYTIPQEDLREFTKASVSADVLQRAGFDSLEEMNAFRYTDFCFKKFIEAAKKSAYFDNTVFVFVGDHGIDGDAGTRFPPAWTEHKLSAYHVPLLFYSPKLVPAQRVPAVASMVDILPTLAGIVNIPYRNNTLGRDLLHQQKVDAGASNVAFIIDRHDQWIGVVAGHYFGRHRLDGSQPIRVWADFKAPPSAAGSAPPLDFHSATNAFYETSRYLLLNNKKASVLP